MGDDGRPTGLNGRMDGAAGRQSSGERNGAAPGLRLNINILLPSTPANIRPRGSIISPVVAGCSLDRMLFYHATGRCGERASIARIALRSIRVTFAWNSACEGSTPIRWTAWHPSCRGRAVGSSFFVGHAGRQHLHAGVARQCSRWIFGKDLVAARLGEIGEAFGIIAARGHGLLASGRNSKSKHERGSDEQFADHGLVRRRRSWMSNSNAQLSDTPVVERKHRTTTIACHGARWSSDRKAGCNSEAYCTDPRA